VTYNFKGLIMTKVILALSDALRYDTAVANMGYLMHLVEYKKASLYKIIGELPSMSRPMYESIHTGLPSSETGVVANSVIRLSNKPNIFSLVREAGKVTAAAAFYWYSELYNRVPYNPIDHKETDDESLNIQHGRFYTEDEYPDIELLNSAARLVRKFLPDYLLFHPMGLDYRGETFGSDSKEYLSHTIYQDSRLAPRIMEWLELGYTVFVTGDHGVNKDGNHGGAESGQREVPFFAIQPSLKGRGETGEIISHLQIAPTILDLLQIPIPATMKHPPLALHPS
jgi:predicted AlkP superfamily pyrophosphatase or phosphodiesterase